MRQQSRDCDWVTAAISGRLNNRLAASNFGARNPSHQCDGTTPPQTRRHPIYFRNNPILFTQGGRYAHTCTTGDFGGSLPGKEEEVSAFLKSALPLANKETQTLSWFAFRIGSSKFGIFDTFPDEAGRNAHLSGEIAKALFAKAGELLAAPPQIEKLDILAAK